MAEKEDDRPVDVDIIRAPEELTPERESAAPVLQFSRGSLRSRSSLAWPR